MFTGQLCQGDGAAKLSLVTDGANVGPGSVLQRRHIGRGYRWSGVGRGRPGGNRDQRCLGADPQRGFAGTDSFSQAGNDNGEQLGAR